MHVGLQFIQYTFRRLLKNIINPNILLCNFPVQVFSLIRGITIKYKKRHHKVADPFIKTLEE